MLTLQSISITFIAVNLYRVIFKVISLVNIAYEIKQVKNVYVLLLKIRSYL